MMVFVTNRQVKMGKIILNFGGKLKEKTKEVEITMITVKP